MKNDILEGKITYDARQASLLASYSMQAEYGNYDADRHSPECLQQDIFFPKVRLFIGISNFIYIVIKNTGETSKKILFQFLYNLIHNF